MAILNAKKYRDVARAIHYLTTHNDAQPELPALAKAIGLSTSYTQKIFSDYVGISPKQFLKYISSERAKKLLRSDGASMLTASHAVGLSSTGRLHDLFVTVESMTSGAYKSGGLDLTISYSFHDTAFGPIIIASTDQGICYLTFIESKAHGLIELTHSFADATLHEDHLPVHSKALSFFLWDQPLEKITLHLRGTSFQLKVWQALLQIPCGGVTTYGDVAHAINCDKAYRAVGTAVGKNPISYIIPCHRVIRSSGALGNYRWGEERKKLLFTRESLY